MIAGKRFREIRLSPFAPRKQRDFRGAKGDRRDLVICRY
jgi:hypothetical protein